MQTRKLGNTDLEVPVVSFGASSLGQEFREIDVNEGLRCVQVALDCGMNYIDTSPFYGRGMSEVLLGKRTVESLKKEAAKSPEYLLVFHAALGFWAEGSGDKEKALGHYKEALESFMDTWLEFDFAIERIKRLREK